MWSLFGFRSNLDPHTDLLKQDVHAYGYSHFTEFSSKSYTWFFSGDKRVILEGLVWVFFPFCFSGCYSTLLVRTGGWSLGSKMPRMSTACWVQSQWAHEAFAVQILWAHSTVMLCFDQNLGESFFEMIAGKRRYVPLLNVKAI